MPTYEYTCSACDTKHEIVQKMTDSTLTECPACGEQTLRKMFNGVGVVFKGSGFYRTDSRSSGSSSSSGDKGGTSDKGGTDKKAAKDSGGSSSTSGSSSSGGSSSGSSGSSSGGSSASKSSSTAS